MNIANILGVSTIDVYDKFLRLPSTVARSKKHTFEFIKERIHKKCDGWKEKLLSKGGKEVLLKAVIASIPIYAMSCFTFLNPYVLRSTVLYLIFYGDKKIRREN